MRTLGVTVGLVAVAVVALLVLQRSPDRRARSRAEPAQSEPAAAPSSTFAAEQAPGAPLDAAVVRGVLVLPSGAWPSSECATVTLLRDGSTVLATTLSNGPFEIPYRRAASDGASFRLVVETDLTPEARVELPTRTCDVGTITLACSAIYGGRIVDIDGVPVPSLTVALRDSDGTVFARSQLSTSDGRFLMGLPPGFVLPTVGYGGVIPYALEIDGRGVSYAPVPADVAGFRAGHHVLLRDPAKLRLRFVAEADGSPVPAATVELRRWQLRRDGIGDAFDRGVTDANGVYAPRWPPLDGIAAIHLRAPDRPRDLIWFVPFPDAPDGEPITLSVPASPATVAVRVVRAGSEAPVAGAVVHVCGVCDQDGRKAQVQHTARTDGDGFARWDLGRDGGIPPESVHLFYWSCTYLAEPDLPTEERGTFDPTADHAGQPYVVAVGGGSEQPVVPLWFTLDGGTEAPSISTTPTRVVVTVGSGDELTYLQLADVLSAPFRNSDGELLYRVYGLVPPAEDDRIEFHVQFDAAAPVWQTATRAQWRAAASSRTPLRFRVPAARPDPGSLVVTAPTGEPRAGAVVQLVPDPVRHTSVIWTDRIVLTTDSRGRASLGPLAGGVAYRGFATDLLTGEAARVDGVQADGRDVTVMLDAPTELKLTARVKDGVLPRARSAVLRSEPAFLLPDVTCTWSDSGEVTAASVFLAGYTLSLDCSTPDGRSRRKVPATEAQGTTIELPPIVGSGVTSPR